MRILASTAVVLLSVACASSKSELLEPAPTPQAAVARVVRTHESRPAEETAESTSACGGGDLPMCHAAALDAYYAPASPESDARARALFEKACEGGYAPSCNGLGVLYDAGRGVAKDPAAATVLYRRACEADASTGCQHLGLALRAGRGVKKDVPAAERAEERGRCLSEASVQRDLRVCPPLDGQER